MGDLNTKSKKRNVPTIEITLTTFSDDGNGPSTGPVKIDGENEPALPKSPTTTETLLDCCSVLKSEQVKNLLLLSFGHFLLWMAFDTLCLLQSAMNARGNMGQFSIAVLYASLAMSSFLLPTAALKRLGCKKTMVYSMIGFCPYILANVYGTWWTLVPSAIVSGTAAGLLWSARSVYLNRAGQKYADIQRHPAGLMNAWFFSVYAVFKQNTQIWGSLLSFYVLRAAHGDEMNSSVTDEANTISCGADFCDEGPVLDLNFPAQGSRFILVAVFTAMSLIAAFFLAFFLEPLELDEPEQEGFSSTDLLATYHNFLNVDQIFLLPLTVYTGLVDGFYSVDFKRVYVACAWGFPHISTVSICYGMVSTLIASASAPCVQILGRGTLFTLASFAHFVMFLAMLLWSPNSKQTAGFFLIASALGIGNGIWISQLVAFYGVLFKENEAAGFSSFYFLNSLGYLLSYSYSGYLCTSAKIYIPLTLLIIGIVCYLVMEIRTMKKILVEYNLKREN